MPIAPHWIALLAALVLAFALGRMLLPARAKAAPPRRRLSLDERAGAQTDAGAPVFRLGRLTLSDAQEEKQQ